MSFISFIAKYADEALATAKALTTMSEGLALAPKQTAIVSAVVAQLENAHKSISKDIKSGNVATVKINKADIESAVAKVLPKLLADEVNKAVVAALAAEAAKDAANK